MQSLDLALEVFPAPDAGESGKHTPGEGADFVVSMITEAMKSIKAERSLLHYLDSLLDLKGCSYLQLLRRSTRLNLQVGAPLTDVDCRVSILSQWTSAVCNPK